MSKIASTVNRISEKLKLSNALVRTKHVWTKNKVVVSPFKDVVVPEVTVYDYMWRNLDKWPTKTGIICGVTNRGYKYEQIYKQSQTLGANLRKKFKIKDGDAVAIVLPNMPEYAIVLLGILSAGGVVTTFNPVYTAVEIQRQLILSEAKLVIAHSELIPTIKVAIGLTKENLPIIAVDVENSAPTGSVSYKELVKDVSVDVSALKEVKRTANDVSLLLYSSGTTGLPKGVELTNKSIVANFIQQDTECRRYDYTTETNQDTALVVLPLFHLYGLNILMLHKLAAGLKLVTLPKFQAETFSSALLERKINLLYMAPPMVLFLASNPQITAKHFDYIKNVFSGAAPLAEADIYKLFEKAGREIPFSQGYGLTETGPLATQSPQEYKNYTSVGFALPNVQLRVVDTELNNLGPGEAGELLIKGPNIMKGYKSNPEANREVFLEDNNWFRSGDVATVDETGAVKIIDRLKELIKVKAYQVAPAELEAVLKEHPDVLDAAVIGVPDPYTGERLKAVVVLKDREKTNEKILEGFVNEKVAPYKRIKDFAVVGSIPKSPSGKILRRILKEQYC